jgi:hypothetical protein
MPLKPPGSWGSKEFAQFTDDELHEEMMGAVPGSNYFEWAKTELQHRDRKRQAQNGIMSISQRVQSILCRCI